QFPLPGLAGCFGRRINDGFMTVVGFHGGDVALSTGKPAHSDLAATMFFLLLVTLSDLLLLPGAASSLSKKNNAFARRGQDLLSAVAVPVDRPDAVLHVQLIADQLANPCIFEGMRRPAEYVERRYISRPARPFWRQQRRDDGLTLPLTVHLHRSQVV